MSKSTESEVLQENLKILSKLQKRPLHTSFDRWYPNQNLGALVMYDYINTSCYHLEVVTGESYDTDFVHHKEIRPEISVLLFGIKTAYQSLMFQLQAVEAILQDVDNHIAIDYTPVATYPRLEPVPAWKKWSEKNPYSQPLVEDIVLFDENGKKTRLHVGNHPSLIRFSSSTSYGFLELIRVAILEYNTWLERISKHRIVIIPMYFIMDTMSEVLHKSIHSACFMKI